MCGAAGAGGVLFIETAGGYRERDAPGRVTYGPRAARPGCRRTPSDVGGIPL